MGFSCSTVKAWLGSLEGLSSLIEMSCEMSSEVNIVKLVINLGIKHTMKCRWIDMYKYKTFIKFEPHQKRE